MSSEKIRAELLRLIRSEIPARRKMDLSSGVNTIYTVYCQKPSDQYTKCVITKTIMSERGEVQEVALATKNGRDPLGYSMSWDDINDCDWVAIDVDEQEN